MILHMDYYNNFTNNTKIFYNKTISRVFIIIKKLILNVKIKSLNYRIIINIDSINCSLVDQLA